MNSIESGILRQQLVATIAALPQKALLELLPFVDYLQYKFSVEQVTTHPPLLELEGDRSSSVPEVEVPLYKRLSPEDLSQAFLDWAESHRGMQLPSLSEQAISRESIYGERG